MPTSSHPPPPPPPPPPPSPPNPALTQPRHIVLCPTLWLEAELRRNSGRSGLGGPGTRFTKSREDIFWEEFEKLLECGADYVGRDYVDFNALSGEQLRPLILECFQRSNSGFKMRLEDPRWNLGKSKDQIVNQILEGLVLLREEKEEGTNSQLHVPEEPGGVGGEEERIETEEDVMSHISPASSESPAMVILDARFCRAGGELDRDNFKIEYGVTYETALLFQNNSDLVAAMDHHAKLVRKRRPAVLTDRRFLEAYEELVKWGLENVDEVAKDIGLKIEILEKFKAVMDTEESGQ